MKKISILLCLALMAGLSACSKKAEGEGQVIESENAEKEVVQEVIKPAVNPEIEKLNNVLMSMTDRCKAAIPNGDPEEFLADLKVVLDAEKNHPQDEDSLYILVDKQHNIGERNPVHIVKLVENDA